jgi:hypothetical protein
MPTTHGAFGNQNKATGRIPPCLDREDLSVVFSYQSIKYQPEIGVGWLYQLSTRTTSSSPQSMLVLTVTWLSSTLPLKIPILVQESSGPPVQPSLKIHFPPGSAVALITSLPHRWISRQVARGAFCSRFNDCKTDWSDLWGFFARSSEPGRDSRLSCTASTHQPILMSCTRSFARQGWRVQSASYW